MPILDRNLLHRFGLLFVILLVGLGLTLTTETFLSVANLTNVACQVSINGILAVGVTFVLLTAGVDLSLGSVVALSGVACATFAHPGDHSVIIPIAVGLLTGAACGLVNGVLVTRGGVAPFIVTLGMMTIARGLALIVSGGRPVANMSNELTALAGDFLGIPIPVLFFAGVALAAWFFLRHFRLGRHIYAVGGMAGGRQALAAPPAEQPGRGEEAGRVRETVPMDAAQAPARGEMDRDRVEVVDPGAEHAPDHGAGFAGASPAPLRPRR